MSTLLSVSDLVALQTTTPGLVLLDVRLPDDYAAERIPGSVNQCVFEIVFFPELEKKGISKDQPICVLGHAQDSHEAPMAAEKLERAGWTQVFEFRGGLDAWRAEGHAVEKSSPLETVSPLADGRYEIDLKESKVEWTGRNLINKHSGQVALSSGFVDFKQGMPVSGGATINMRRIMCSDLAGSDLHDVLIHHLESDDFFDVGRFPIALFSFHRAERCSECPGCTNLKLHGQFTMKAITHPLVIDATAGYTPEGKAALQANFTLNRTQWEILYGSGSFFRRLAGHLVNDAIEIQLRIITA